MNLKTKKTVKNKVKLEEKILTAEGWKRRYEEKLLEKVKKKVKKK